MKKISILFILFILIFSLSACGADIESEKKDEQDKTLSTSADGRRLDFGQPERPADIFGIVKSVIGNEVTLYKLQNNSENREARNENAESQNPESAIALPGTASESRRGMGGGMGMMRPGTEVNADDMVAMMKSRSIGEEKVLIPVGIRMLKIDNSSEEDAKNLEASLEDVKEDKILRIWLDEGAGDRKVAEFVFVR